MNDQDIKNGISKKLEADIIIYSGEISNVGAEQLIDLTRHPTNKNVLLSLCTPGGDPNAAFKIARKLQDRYARFYLYVYGYCKSAGTLIAIGSDEIIMSDYAEFGPLDVQLQEKDEIYRYSSGLNINEALVIIEKRARYLFSSTLIELVGSAGISTKTAAELATKLAIGFVAPLISQIDPVRVGEIQRAIRIALAYGERLISKRGNLASVTELAELVQGYPDHGFVIDYEEAKQIFKCVRKHDDTEELLGRSMSELKHPANDVIIKKVYPGGQNEELNKRADIEGAGKSDAETRKTNCGNIGEVLSINKSEESTA